MKADPNVSVVGDSSPPVDSAVTAKRRERPSVHPSRARPYTVPAAMNTAKMRAHRTRTLGDHAARDRVFSGTAATNVSRGPPLPPAMVPWAPWIPPLPPETSSRPPWLQSSAPRLLLVMS